MTEFHWSVLFILDIHTWYPVRMWFDSPLTDQLAQQEAVLSWLRQSLTMCRSRTDGSFNSVFHTHKYINYNTWFSYHVIQLTICRWVSPITTIKLCPPLCVICRSRADRSLDLCTLHTHIIFSNDIINIVSNSPFQVYWQCDDVMCVIQPGVGPGSTTAHDWLRLELVVV